MSDCIFCKIANHEIESTIFFENDEVVAFDDLNPKAPVHALIVPKAHYADVGDDVPDDVRAALMAAIPEVARIKGLDNGYRTVINTGPDGGQEVGHLHIHVLGGMKF